MPGAWARSASKRPSSTLSENIEVSGDGIVLTAARGRSERGEASDDVVRNRVVPRRHPGRWLVVVLIVVIGFQAVQGIATNPNFHWGTYAEYIFAPNVLRGVGWTLLLTVIAMAVAIPLALLLVIMRESTNPIL